MSRYELLHGDCLEKLKELPDCSVDAVVTDPPYELAFMGKKWDASGIAFRSDVWLECLRVLKPGGHLLAFGGTRTYHRMACAIEDAGFEVRDSIHWMYGCLSEDTEILVNGEWCHYSKATEGSLTLCYDVEHDSYSWQPIEQQFLYPYDDTAYRLIGERTDQLVSRNHRCLVQRDGRWQFAVAEEVAREQETRVPILEALPDLLDALRLSRSGASGSSEVLRNVRDVEAQVAPKEAREDLGFSPVCGLRSGNAEASGMAQAGEAVFLLNPLQREGAGAGTGQALAQGATGLDRRESSILSSKNVGREESSMEGRGDIQEEQGQLYRSEVCSLPDRVHADGAQGRLCNGASPCSSYGDRALSESYRSCASCGSRHPEQQPIEPNAVCDQPRSQVVRGERFTVSDLVRVEPVHLTGRVWCVKVPTGAFVARRNGKVFVTGNSGFPKSLDVSKAIDKMMGAERKVVGYSSTVNQKTSVSLKASKQHPEYGDRIPVTAPTTPEAAKWEGFGTALKPAHEPIVMARKPLIGTVAQNVLAHGTGAINVDGCRVGVDKRINNPSGTPGTGRMRACNLIDRGDGKTPDGRDLAKALAYVEQSRHREPQEVSGRWPPNVIFSHLPECEESECAEGCAVAELDAQSGTLKSGGGVKANKGTTSRFFPAFRYQAKAPTKERKVEGISAQHPTQKPVELMRWLVRLVTPPGGVVLDPFTGSGTTGVAALLEGFKFIGCEREDEYFAIANVRIRAAEATPSNKQPTLFDLDAP